MNKLASINIDGTPLCKGVWLVEGKLFNEVRYFELENDGSIRGYRGEEQISLDIEINQWGVKFNSLTVADAYADRVSMKEGHWHTTTQDFTIVIAQSAFIVTIKPMAPLSPIYYGEVHHGPTFVSKVFLIHFNEFIDKNPL